MAVGHYSAGIVEWTKKELVMNRLWQRINACTQKVILHDYISQERKEEEAWLE